MDFSSVRNAVFNLSESIDGVILNAGGVSKDTKGTTNDGVTNIMALNILGHTLLVDEMIHRNKLVKGATVIYAGSEEARGVPMLGIPQPKVESGSVDEFKGAIDGSMFVQMKDDQASEAIYAYSKLIASLWNGSMSRKFPDYRFIVVSPRLTGGTAITYDLPLLK